MHNGMYNIRCFTTRLAEARYSVKKNINRLKDVNQRII